MPFKVKKRNSKQVYKNCMFKEKNGKGMIGMHCVVILHQVNVNNIIDGSKP
jgi:hypothetical protein